MNHKRFNRDLMMNASRKAVARATVQVFDRLQDLRKECQILALAAAFLLLATAAGVPAQEAFTAVKNLMEDRLNPTGLDKSFAAMRYHLETELLQ